MDKYIRCVFSDCDGVMQRLGEDTRSKRQTFKCDKCGRAYTVDRISYDAGRNTFQLSNPNDPLRGAIK